MSEKLIVLHLHDGRTIAETIETYSRRLVRPISDANLMLVTSLCWLLNVGDHFPMLMIKQLCWLLIFTCW